MAGYAAIITSRRQYKWLDMPPLPPQGESKWLDIIPPLPPQRDSKWLDMPPLPPQGDSKWLYI